MYVLTQSDSQMFESELCHLLMKNEKKSSNVEFLKVGKGQLQLILSIIITCLNHFNLLF